MPAAHPGKGPSDGAVVPSGAESPPPAEMIRQAVVLQLKLILEGVKDVVLGPIALVGLLIDLLLRQPHERKLFYQVLRGGERFEEFLDLYAALREREPTEADVPRRGPTLDKVLSWSERQVRTYVEDRKERRGPRGPSEPPTV